MNDGEELACEASRKARLGALNCNNRSQNCVTEPDLGGSRQPYSEVWQRAARNQDECDR